MNMTTTDRDTMSWMVRAGEALLARDREGMRWACAALTGKLDLEARGNERTERLVRGMVRRLEQALRA